jgi:Polyketide cyclase / dehydrase and lipid transport
MSSRRARLQCEVEVAAPAGEVWDYVTDWPRQGEWVPGTRVENVDDARGLGGRLRAWTGCGPVGFWDPMTITRWERTPDGGGVCEVLHLGSVVKGEGEFTVVALGEGRSRFVWAEVVVLPFGALGAVAWRVVGPVVARFVDHGLRTVRDRVEASGAGAGAATSPRRPASAWRRTRRQRSGGPRWPR